MCPQCRCPYAFKNARVLNHLAAVHYYVKQFAGTCPAFLYPIDIITGRDFENACFVHNSIALNNHGWDYSQIRCKGTIFFPYMQIILHIFTFFLHFFTLTIITTTLEPSQDPRNTIPGSSQYHPMILAIPTRPCGVKPHAARPRCARPVGVPSVAEICIGCLQTAQIPSLPCGIGGFPPHPRRVTCPRRGCPSPRFCPPLSRHYLALPRAADCRVMAAKKDWGPGTLRRCVGNLPLFRLGPNAPFFAAAGVNRPLVAAAIGCPPPMSSGFLQGRRPAGERRPAAYC